jgi:hypothetical protein
MRLKKSPKPESTIPSLNRLNGIVKKTNCELALFYIVRLCLEGLKQYHTSTASL